MDKNSDIVSSIYTAFKDGKMNKFVSVMSDELVWTEMETQPTGGTFHGVNEVLEKVMEPISQKYDSDYSAIPDEIIDGGDTIVVLGTYSGTVSSSSRFFSAPFAHIWKLENGKVTSFRQYTDTVLVNAPFN